MRPSPAIPSAPLVFNGVDGATGDYLFPTQSFEELARVARAAGLERAFERQLKSWVRESAQRSMAPKEGVDPRRLEQTGWGVVFAEDTDPRVREALEPLLAHRRRQAGRLRPERYRELTGKDGYRAGESKLRFLARHGVGAGPADPDRMPYYLLLVGDPETLPYELQYQLDVQYGVGRLCFDTPEEYAHYAEAVVAAEQGHFPRPNRAVFFGVRKDGDSATERTHDDLVAPLAGMLGCETGGWEVVEASGPAATRQRLGRLLGGEETPALLFTASHGLGYPLGHPDQRERQGALVCQEWSGPPSPGVDVSPYFTAADLSDDACPAGLIAFTFACYSGGTPRLNDYAERGPREPVQKSERAFVARLPQRLLGHPRGGALAVVGHVDRAWTYSFDWPLAGRQLEVFASALRRLAAGHPLGSAMEFFNQRFAELEVDLAELRQEGERGLGPDLIELVGLWTACRDARNYVVFGDPAVRLEPAARELLRGAS